MNGIQSGNSSTKPWVLLLLTLAAACTDTVVEMQAPAGAAEPWAFSARTLDDTKLYLATLEVNARGRSFAADAPDGMGGAGAGLRWRNKYGFVGVTWAASTPGVYDDGLNERGLSVAQNQLDETAYPNVTDPGAAVGMRAVVGWLLGRAADVAEARALLEERYDPGPGGHGAQVWGKAGGGPGGDAGAERQHLHLLDAAGGELLVEWVGGAQHVYAAEDGTWGTATNSPDFPTMRAMRAYGRAFPTSFASVGDNGSFNGGGAGAAGRGGLNGVPAANDSWSRQARVAMLRRVAPALNTTAQAVAWCFRLLDQVSVPGVPAAAAAGAAGGATSLPADGVGDFTQWQLVRDHSEGGRALYSRTWDNLLPQRLRLADLNFSEGAPLLSFAMGDGDWAGEMVASTPQQGPV